MPFGNLTSQEATVMYAKRYLVDRSFENVAAWFQVSKTTIHRAFAEHITPHHVPGKRKRGDLIEFVIGNEIKHYLKKKGHIS